MMRKIPELQTLLTGLAFGESPRWHDDRLWFSDFGAQEVDAVDLSGKKEVIARIAGAPMGLGFLPDGRLLIVSMRDGLLLRREHDGRLVTHADLSNLSRYPWSDMVVDGRGNAYIGNLGFNFPGGEFAPGSFACTLGGVDRRTLFLMAAEYPPASWGPEAARTGQVLTAQAPAPGAGWP